MARRKRVYNNRMDNGRGGLISHLQVLQVLGYHLRIFQQSFRNFHDSRIQCCADPHKTRTHIHSDIVYSLYHSTQKNKTLEKADASTHIVPSNTPRYLPPILSSRPHYYRYRYLDHPNDAARSNPFSLASLNRYNKATQQVET